MIKKLAIEFTGWAAEQFNSDRKLIPAAVRFQQFADTKHLAEQTKTAVLVLLINEGVV